MRVVIDIEANGLENPTEIWCVVCKDIDTGTYYKFKNVTNDKVEHERLLRFLEELRSTPDHLFIGHNVLGYDCVVLNSLLKLHPQISPSVCIDTLVISKLVNYSRTHGHSLESYGIEYNYEKGKNYYEDFFKAWSQPLEDYCVRDVDITHKVYLNYLSVITSPDWAEAIALEQAFQCVVNTLHDNGFSFNTDRATSLLGRVTGELDELDEKILEAFPPKEVLIREFIPRATKFGTISRTSVPRSLHPRIHEYEVGRVYRHTRHEPFNPSSHKQLIDVLCEAGWKPTDKTKTHIDTERELNRLKYSKEGANQVDIDNLCVRLGQLEKSGYKINENNLSTLPQSAPASARVLAKRILLESRRRTLTEWLGLVQDDGRIHGKFYAMGAWTHRMSHQSPNTANIPNATKEDGSIKLLGKELRSLWQAPKKRLLVGVDAEGIQLRIFAHYVDDPELTQSLIDGRKSDKTDPHSLNQRVLGSICKSRQAAKRFLYALLLGGGVGKFAEILGCTKTEAEEAVDKFNKRYPGFSYLKRYRFPGDAKRGFFIGLDGRRVQIPGDTLRDRQHLCMSGYLQSGEAIVMKRATLKWVDKLKDYNSLLVNLVHDEWQTEVPNDMEIAVKIAQMQSDSLHEVGEELKLKCSLAGSYYNEDKKDYTIGTNWSTTH